MFAAEHGDDIILSSKLNDKTIFIRLQNIHYWTLVAKVPGMTERAFENFLRNCNYTHFDKVMLFESNTSTLN